MTCLLIGIAIGVLVTAFLLVLANRLEQRHVITEEDLREALAEPFLAEIEVQYLGGKIRLCVTDVWGKRWQFQEKPQYAGETFLCRLNGNPGPLEVGS